MLRERAAVLENFARDRNVGPAPIRATILSRRRRMALNRGRSSSVSTLRHLLLYHAAGADGFSADRA